MLCQHERIPYHNICKLCNKRLPVEGSDRKQAIQEVGHFRAAYTKSVEVTYANR